MFAPSVEISEGSKTYNIGYNPILRFQFAKQFVEGGNIYDKSNAYTIYPRTIFRAIEFFNTVLSWYSDPKMKDLFLLDNDNNLIFNADYKDLHCVLDIRTPNTDYGILKAIPVLGVYGDQEPYEAAFLYMNKSTNRIILSVDEISTILGILNGFSFYEESLFCLSAFKYAKDNNVIKVNTYSGFTPFSTPNQPQTTKQTPFTSHK